MKTWIILTLAGLILLWGNPASPQPIISIWGNADSLIVRDQVAQYLNYLDVWENIHVSVGFTTKMPDKLEGMTFCLDSTASTTYQIMRVWIDARLSKTEQKFVLAHEMIHVKQYAKGELREIDQEQVMWKGRKFQYHGAAERHRAPWESEAYKNDHWLARQYKPQPENPLVAAVKNQ